MADIYLDYAATTPVAPEVVEAVLNCMKRNFGNPSSLHRLGIEAEKTIKEAKARLANHISVLPEEIIFTSGGTEANNLSILGCVRAREREGRHCITTTIEHPSVLNVFEYLEKQGYEVTYLPVGKNGEISIENLKAALRPDTVLVSIMHVNNEIGSIQPIEKVGRLLNRLDRKPVFHVDAIQSLGKVELKPRQWEVDLMSFSGHKIHALKGIGAIFKKKDLRIHPLQYGGAQEGGLRSGTENITGIVSMGVGVDWIARRRMEEPGLLYNLKKTLTAMLREELPQTVFNGPAPQHGAPHILNISFPGIRGEVLLHALEERGVFVSTGSACSSRHNRISHVLKAIDLDSRTAEGAIRISMSYTTTLDEIKVFVNILSQCVKQLERYIRR